MSLKIPKMELAWLQPVGSMGRQSFELSSTPCIGMPGNGLHFNRSLDISSMVLWYVAPKVHIISHKNKQANLWNKKYSWIHLSPQRQGMRIQLAATGGGKFENLPHKQVKKKKKNRNTFAGELKLQETAWTI